MTDDKREVRTVVTGEIRALTGEGQTGRTLTGYAAVFNALSEDLGGFVEQIAPGAFKKTLQEADVRALWNHSPDVVLGRTKSGTLRLVEDQVGLRFELDLPNTQAANDLIELVNRGDVNQMSFAFRTVKDAWAPAAANEMPVRTLQEVALLDVSPVTYPAYPQTSAAVRAMVEQLSQHNDEPGQAAHSEEQPQGWLEVQRMRLELAEKANI